MLFLLLIFFSVAVSALSLGDEGELTHLPAHTCLEISLVRRSSLCQVCAVHHAISKRLSTAAVNPGLLEVFSRLLKALFLENKMI